MVIDRSGIKVQGIESFTGESGTQLIPRVAPRSVLKYNIRANGAELFKLPGCRSNDPNGGSEHERWVYPTLHGVHSSKRDFGGARGTVSTTLNCFVCFRIHCIRAASLREALAGTPNDLCPRRGGSYNRPLLRPIVVQSKPILPPALVGDK